MSDGMQGDKPLTMKLSVNLTPHGTMIFSPADWFSFFLIVEDCKGV